MISKRRFLKTVVAAIAATKAMAATEKPVVEAKPPKINPDRIITYVDLYWQRANGFVIQDD